MAPEYAKTITCLILAALASIPIYFVYDHAIERFRRKPDPARAAVIRRYNSILVAAGAVFYFSVSLIGLILDIVRGNFADGVPGYTAGFSFASLAVALLLRTIFGAKRPRLDAESLPPYAGARLPYFPGMLRKLRGTLELTSTYKVFMAPTMLCGAEVADKVDRASGRFVRAFGNPISLRDTMFYDAFDVSAPGFLKLNPTN